MFIMKPIEAHGIRLEDLGELGTTVEALRFLGQLPALAERSRTDADNLATALDDLRRVGEAPNVVRAQEATTPADKLPTSTFDITDMFPATLVNWAVELAAEHHPDPLIRDAAADMKHSYEKAVYENAMGSGEAQT